MRIQKKPALLATLLIVMAALGVWYATKPATAKLAAPTAIPVRVVSVTAKDVPRYVSGIGSVLSLQSVVVRPQIDGILTKIMLKEGKLVNKLKATAQGNQASIDAAQVQLSYTQIRSPVTGRVGIRTVDEGNFLRMADAQGLFTVTQIDPIAV